MKGQRFSTHEEAVDAFGMQGGKSASTIGSNTCESILILMGNILKNNKAIFDD